MAKSLNNFDQYINQALDDWHIPGAAVAVVKGNDVLHMGGYGLRDVEQGLPVSEHTRFPIASMTKPFTAMGAALLVDDGLLEWDQPIRDVMPEFRLADEYATQHANLCDLLSHRTGLPRHESAWYGQDKTHQELLQGLYHLKPNSSFRGAWQYNNLMYETVGYICARLTGFESWQQFLQKRILDVLGMKNTTPNFDESHKQFDEVALPYMLKQGESKPIQMPYFEFPQASPAGSIVSSLNDLVTWMKVHTHGGTSNGVPFVTPSNLKQMHTPHMSIQTPLKPEHMFNNNLCAYGLGWFIEPYQGVTLLHHGGNVDGFSVTGAFVPQEDLSIIVLTNINAKDLRDVLVYEALDRILGIEGKDWNQEFLKRDKTTVQAMVKAMESSKDERIDSRPSTHSLEAYAGTYAIPGYAEIEIKWEAKTLHATFLGKWWKLEHYHYDVFELDMSDQYQGKMKVAFGLDTNGEITSLSIPIEPTLNDFVFKRKPLKVSNQVLEKLVGCYDFPIDSQNVVVTLKKETLYMTLPRGAEKALHCVKQSHDRLHFGLEKNENFSVEFIESHEGYEELCILHSGIAQKCARL
ncbi:serine hydrolase [SAR92 clade bacterium H455]|uniref:Serine hydrolase n=1 Tax=SAR92 clade bacterium H455 TaxID=2974818 RepID=A0ABY5TK67_9GAMM|nr:serine hydrolase [SAR92 clade bacterium H455]